MNKRINLLYLVVKRSNPIIPVYKLRHTLLKNYLDVIVEILYRKGLRDISM